LYARFPPSRPAGVSEGRQLVPISQAFRYDHSKVEKPIGRRFSNPSLLLALIAALIALVVQSGELGSSDTMHRLQTAHSFWTAEPAVFPNEYPEFGVHGRHGKLYDWYGIGQPLLLLPIDVIGTWLENRSIFDDYRSDPTVRNIFVVCVTNILISVLTALICYRFLLELGFDVFAAVGGVLALLFCTTHLHYTQNMMENNYIFLLTLSGFRFEYRWLRTQKLGDLLVGAIALGFDLLTRLTTAMDFIAVGLFLLLIVYWERDEGRRLLETVLAYLKVVVPVTALFLLVDRIYQYYRFGTWTDTYVRYFTLEHRLHDPTLPARYPWETPFHVGFFGALLSPEKSIFLFDPLILLTLVLAAFAWKRFSVPVKAFQLAAGFLMLAYVCFYARYTVWSGDFAWGDRYASTAVEIAAFLSVPLLLHFRKQLGRAVWTTGVLLVTASVLIQLASVLFWLPLEIYQMEDLGHPQFVIWLRFKNIVAFALGRMDAWGLTTDAMQYDTWDYQHITTWNFLPFVLRRMGDAPRWVFDAALTAWALAIAALIATTIRLRNILLAGDTASGPLRASSAVE
jgi:hypothetical protein